MRAAECRTHFLTRPGPEKMANTPPDPAPRIFAQACIQGYNNNFLEKIFTPTLAFFGYGKNHNLYVFSHVAEFYKYDWKVRFVSCYCIDVEHIPHHNTASTQKSTIPQKLVSPEKHSFY
jgi:hypothetical protein